MLHSPIDSAAQQPADHRFGGIARHDVLRRHALMVRRIAWNVHSNMSSSIEMDDLVQIGMIALIECADSYEDRGFAFATYASTRVRGAMIDQLRKSVRMTRSAMIIRRRLSATATVLEKRLMRAPRSLEVAEEMNMPLDAYYCLQSKSAAVVVGCIDEFYSDHDSAFSDPAPRADMAIEERQMGARLSDCITTLAEREANILRLFFVEELNLNQIGQALGVGAARVCQIKKSALSKLRSQMEAAESD